MVEIILSKLQPPHLSAGIMDRVHLQDRAVRLEKYRVITLTAPAGYGKTVTMKQMVQAIKRPVIWYHLDEYDNDPIVFIQYLAAGIQPHLPTLAQKILTLLQPETIESTMRTIVGAFLNAFIAEEHNELTIAFDNMHHVSNPMVLHFLQEMIDHLPDNLQIIAASRITPPFSLVRLQLDEKVLNLRVEQLRFDSSEIAAFFKDHFSFSEEILEELETKTSGWPAYLRWLRTKSKPILQIDPKEFYPYIETEIFKALPEKIQDFLLKTSTLEKLTPRFCDELLHIDNSRIILETLKEQQLIEALEGQEDGYQYQTILQNFLQDRLGPARDQVVLAAAQFAEVKGEWSKAIEGYLRVGKIEDIVRLLKPASEEALMQGRWLLVEHWLSFLTAEQIRANGWPMLFQTKAEIYRGRLKEAEKLLRGVMGFFTEHALANGIAECHLLQARILRSRGSYAKSLKLLEKAVSSIGSDESGTRFDISLEQSLNLWMMGRFNDAAAVIHEALRTAELENNGLVMAYLLEGLGNIYYLKGEYHKALQVYYRGIDLSPDRVLPSYFTQDYVAAIYQEWGELDQALEFAIRNVTIKEKYGVTEALPSAYHQLAIIYLDRGDYSKAKELLNRSIDLIQTTSGDIFYLTLNKIFLARCFYMEGHWIEALSKAKEALSEANLQAGLVKAICQEVYGSIILLMGRFWEAERIFQEVLPDFEAMGFMRGTCFCYSALGLCSYYRRNLLQAGQFFKKSLETGAKLNLIQSYVTPFDFARPILRYGLENGIEVDFIQRVVVRRGIKAVSFLQKLAVHTNSDTRSRAIPPLAEIGGKKAYSILLRLTKDQDRHVQEIAKITAVRLGLIKELTDISENAPIRVKNLGTFIVFTDEKEQTVLGWQTSKTRDLLAYLIHQSQPVTIDRVLEDLWPELSLEKATTNFHTTLYRLRQAMSKIAQHDVIIYRNKQYSIAPHLFVSDHKIFEELTGNSMQGKLTPEKIEALDRASKLYEGDYLEELDYIWLLPTQEYLKQLFQDINLRLAQFYMDAKDYSKGIEYLQKLISINPFSEEFYRLLFSAYAGMGDRVSIQKQYKSLTKILHKELGILPANETQELYRKLCS